jgi:hypothetical protein
LTSSTYKSKKQGRLPLVVNTSFSSRSKQRKEQSEALALNKLQGDDIFDRRWGREEGVGKRRQIWREFIKLLSIWE